jgi:hypothetical protein
MRDNQIADKVAPQLMRILSTDSSEDVIGRASHVTRYLPREDVAAWAKDQTFRLKWTFPDDPRSLDGLRQISWLHTGYCLAEHGLPDAVSFMNECAENDDVMVNIACWNKKHARRDMDTLLKSLKEKAESNRENMAAFRRWHRRVYDVTLKMADFDV